MCIALAKVSYPYCTLYKMVVFVSNPIVWTQKARGHDRRQPNMLLMSSYVAATWQDLPTLLDSANIDCKSRNNLTRDTKVVLSTLQNWKTYKSKFVHFRHPVRRSSNKHVVTQRRYVLNGDLSARYLVKLIRQSVGPPLYNPLVRMPVGRLLVAFLMLKPG